MSSDHSTQYVEDDDFGGDAGVTTTERRTSDNAAAAHKRFWQEFYSRGDRQLEPNRLDRKIEILIQPQLEELMRLPAGWDSYGAPPIRPEAVSFALSVLNSIMKLQTPLPQVVPTSVGGVQLEWHEKDIDLELHISAPYNCEVLFHDHRDTTALPLHQDLTMDFRSLSGPIDLRTTR
jgi:hypothetical protein